MWFIACSTGAERRSSPFKVHRNGNAGGDMTDWLLDGLNTFDLSRVKRGIYTPTVDVSESFSIGHCWRSSPSTERNQYVAPMSDPTIDFSSETISNVSASSIPKQWLFGQCILNAHRSRHSWGTTSCSIM